MGLAGGVDGPPVCVGVGDGVPVGVGLGVGFGVWPPPAPVWPAVLPPRASRPLFSASSVIAFTEMSVVRARCLCSSANRAAVMFSFGALEKSTPPETQVAFWPSFWHG